MEIKSKYKTKSERALKSTNCHGQEKCNNNNRYIHFNFICVRPAATLTIHNILPTNGVNNNADRGIGTKRTKKKRRKNENENNEKKTEASWTSRTPIVCLHCLQMDAFVHL